MFNLEWGGRATDFVPELLKTTGKPGRVAAAARDAVWESVQRIGEQDAGAWVRVTVNGQERADRPGLGRFTLSVDVLDIESTGPQDFQTTTTG